MTEPLPLIMQSSIEIAWDISSVPGSWAMQP